MRHSAQKHETHLKIFSQAPGGYRIFSAKIPA